MTSDVKELVERLLREADLADQVEQSTVFGSPRTSREAASALSLLAQEREELRALLRRIDNRIVWETEEGFGRAFQDEVEAALKDT